MIKQLVFNTVNYLYRLNRKIKLFKVSITYNETDRNWRLQERSMDYLQNYEAGQKTNCPELKLLRKLHK